jgi:beta-glucanase (GH16 family)
MKQFLTPIAILIATNLLAINVTFRLNMNGLQGFGTPEVNGTFNNWCGNCNSMSDANNDGIWEATLNLPAGNYEYKFSYDSWSGQENLSATTGCSVTNGNFTNRTLNVQSDVVLPIVCWGLCSECLQLEPETWPLTWSEEFDGNELNPETWSYNIGTGASGWGNNELQYYTSAPENALVSNGSLKITARNESINGSNYSSSRIITNNLFEFQYGRVEARIKVPMGKGLWPAFWMLGGNFETVSWPQCGEIDIMEHINNEQVISGTVHWNNNNHDYKGSSAPFSPNDFHLYGIVWDQESVVFTLDNHPYFEFPFVATNNTEQIFRNPFFLILNVAVGGNWPGNPDLSTVFPAVMEVDYIRLYQNDVSKLNDDQTESDIVLYPNPFQNTLNFSQFDLSGDTHIEVRDFTGKLIHHSNLNQLNCSVNTESWNEGIYHVSVVSGSSRVFNYKIIKSN